MKHRFWISILAVPLLVAACGTTNVAPSNDPRAELLALHEEAMRAHRESSAELLLRSEAPEFVSGSRGQVTQPSLEVRQARFWQYLGMTRFTEYVDVVPPIVRVSDDGTLGWVIVQVRGSGVQTTPDGGSQPLAFESAAANGFGSEMSPTSSPEERGPTWKTPGSYSDC